MKYNAENNASSRARTKVWGSFLTTAIGVVGSLISVFSTTADLFQLPITIIFSIGAVVITSLFTFVLEKREIGPSRVAKLKHRLTTAYLISLDGSALNPSKGGER